MERKKILISGQMRSGTTFIANYLNSRDKMAVYSDTLVSLFKMIEALDLNDLEANNTKRVNNIIISNIIADGLNYAVDFNKLWELQDPSWLEIYNTALDVIFQKQDIAICGVKVTKSEQAIATLLRNDHRVVYCIRDPRDVILSARNRFPGVSVSEYLYQWKKSYNEIKQYRSHANFYLLQYENLMLRPENELKELSDFLGLSISYNPEDPLQHRNSGLYNDNSSFGDIERLFDSKGVARWRQIEGKESWIAYVGSVSATDLSELEYANSSVSWKHTLKYEAFRLAKEKIRDLRKLAKHKLKG